MLVEVFYRLDHSGILNGLKSHGPRLKLCTYSSSSRCTDGPKAVTDSRDKIIMKSGKMEEGAYEASNVVSHPFLLEILSLPFLPWQFVSGIFAFLQISSPTPLKLCHTLIHNYPKMSLTTSCCACQSVTSLREDKTTPKSLPW